MECGGLSVMEEDGAEEGTGTLGMLLLCAGSSATSMKVRTYNAKTS